MELEKEVPNWPEIHVEQLDGWVFFACTKHDGVVYATSARDRDLAINGLHEDLRREAGVTIE